MDIADDERDMRAVRSDAARRDSAMSRDMLLARYARGSRRLMVLRRAMILSAFRAHTMITVLCVRYAGFAAGLFEPPRSTLFRADAAFMMMLPENTRHDASACVRYVAV